MSKWLTGKTTMLAQLMQDQGEVIALDRSNAKVNLIGPAGVHLGGYTYTFIQGLIFNTLAVDSCKNMCPFG